MKSKSLLVLLFCIMAAAARAQNDTSIANAAALTKDTTVQPIDSIKTDTSTSCNIGPAPPLRVKEWIKGQPVTRFEQGKVYVVEFWATWCEPCMRAMPHLSELARKYRGKITFLAIDIWEPHANFPKTSQQVKTLVGVQGRKMDFAVATEDTSYTNNDWLKAYGLNSIPTAFVVNGQGQIAWFGHPAKIDAVLEKVLDNTWDIKGDLLKRASTKYLDSLDYTVIAKVDRFQPKFSGRNYLGFPDSTLMVIDEMVKKEPRLKYAPYVGQYTFAALL